MDNSQVERRDRLILEERHDTYQERGKWPEATACRECGAVFLEGRWSWRKATANAHTIVCPACQRIQDAFPAGHLELRGEFFVSHREEINNLIRNLETQEKEEHPMERIMAISTEGDHATVTTTGIHLARRIGEALKHAYQGELGFTYGDAEKSIRVAWCRE